MYLINPPLVTAKGLFFTEIRSICGLVLGMISMRLVTTPAPSSRMKIPDGDGWV
jgi:hypothetical protein